jgi:hypothetical protein
MRSKAMDERSADRFATSLVALSLIRAGFEVRESVRFGSKVIDILANRFEDDGSETIFGVECKWVRFLNNLHRENYFAQASALALNSFPIEVAVVIGDGAQIRVTPALQKHMVFDASEMTVEPL